MKKILVFNLTRLGDLLQSTPMLEWLRGEYPDAHISLLANKTFEGICEFIPFIDDVHIFNIKKFKPALLGKEISLVEVYRYMEELLSEMESKQFDLVINLTHSKLSAMFSHMVGAPEVIGLVATDYGDRQIKGGWIAYFCSMVFNREFSRFNLVDLYTKGVGGTPSTKKLHLKLSGNAEEYTETFIRENSISSSDFIVGFQPGSSRKDRRWPAQSFVRLANDLYVSLGSKIVLFGTSAEEDIGEVIERESKGPIINSIGKTNLTQLVGTLRRVDILVTNDTGTMHIASALGIRVVALFFAHALCFETGPYAEGQVILQADIPCSPCSHQVECNNMLCKEYIEPVDVFEIMKMIRLNEKDLARSLNSDQEHFKKVKVLTPVFDKDGLYDCLPLKKCLVTERDVIGMAYKEVWKLLLDRSNPLETSDLKTDEQVKTISSYVLDRVTTYFLFDAQFMEKVCSVIQVSVDAFDDLLRISNEGVLASEGLLAAYAEPQKNIPRITTIGEQLFSIDERVEMAGMVSHALRPLIQLFTFGKENLEGNDIAILAKETRLLYLSLYLGSSLMSDILRTFMTKIVSRG